MIWYITVEIRGLANLARLLDIVESTKHEFQLTEIW